MSNTAKDFIQKLLKKDPQKRWTAQQVCVCVCVCVTVPCDSPAGLLCVCGVAPHQGLNEPWKEMYVCSSILRAQPPQPTRQPPRRVLTPQYRNPLLAYPWLSP